MNNLINDAWGSKASIEIEHVPELTLPLSLFVICAAGFGRRVSWVEDDVTSLGTGHEMSFKVSNPHIYEEMYS